MSLTEDQITKGRTYTVAIPVRDLSFKRRGDAVALVKGIDGQREGYVYDPQNPQAFSTGYVVNEDPACASSKYDGAAQTWTVTIPAAGGRALNDLRNLVHAYGASVEVAETGTPAPVAPAPARPAKPAPRRSTVRNGIDWAEYGDGFSPLDERPYMGR